MLLGLLGLMSLALVLAGATMYTVQLSSTKDRIDASLRHAEGIFRELATDPTEQHSGERLLYLAMQRTLPAQNEGMVAFVDNSLRWSAPAQVPLRLEDDPELMQWIAQAPAASASLRSIGTDRAEYRLMILPISDASGRSGKLVYAFSYTAERAQVNAAFLGYLWVGLGTLAVVGVAGWFVVGRLLRPLRTLSSTAQRITQENLSERIPVGTNDDLAELTRTINNMLDRVEEAVLSQQRLLDDAGHELRTPITVVQGHLELMDTEDPQDAAAVRELALDELERMSLLVSDLVTLAQSGSTSFLRTGPTDVADLLTELLAKASALGDREWVLRDPAPGVAILDSRRITQAMLQLASNAVKFSSPGALIELGGRLDEERGEALLWVRDEGIGIPAHEQDRVFERFARGSGAKRADGAGLGLSIVHAIALAHGGSIELSSAAGTGSTFLLRLPLNGPAPTHLPEEAE